MTFYNGEEKQDALKKIVKTMNKTKSHKKNLLILLEK